MRLQFLVACSVALLLAAPASSNAQSREAAAPTQPRQPMVLVTEDEAARPAAAILPAFESRSITRRPDIRVVAPETATSAAPVPLEIKFTAPRGSRIVPKSIKLIYLKEPPINLTPRILDYISADGIVIPQVKLFRGTHLFEVEVTDSGGRQSKVRFEINVAE